MISKNLWTRKDLIISCHRSSSNIENLMFLIMATLSYILINNLFRSILIRIWSNPCNKFSWKSLILPKGLSNLNTYQRPQIHWGLVICWRICFLLFQFSLLLLCENNEVYSFVLGYCWRLAFHFTIIGNRKTDHGSCASCLSRLTITM